VNCGALSAMKSRPLYAKLRPACNLSAKVRPDISALLG